MPTKYFKKELPKNPLFSASGEQIRFDFISPNIGFMQTEDPALITELEKCIAQKRNGVLPCTEEEFAEFQKKKQDLASSVSQLAESGIPIQPPSFSTQPGWREEISPAMMGDTLQTIKTPQGAGAAQVSDLSEPAPQKQAAPAVRSQPAIGRRAQPAAAVAE